MGPTAAFINLPDHIGKQTDEYLRVPPQEASKTPPATKPACPTGCFFLEMSTILCALSKYLKTLISPRDTPRMLYISVQSKQSMVVRNVSVISMFTEWK